MKNFLDLNSLYEQIKKIITSKEYQEIELPWNFKSQLPTIGDRMIVYHRYSAIAYKKNADAIIIPNYWFYLATDILPYNIEIHRYYEQIVSLNLFSSARLNELKTSGLTDTEWKKLESSFESKQDAERIRRFLTDYKWWHGGKELGRVQKDYFVSAVLSLSGLVNDSASYLSVLCEVVRENPQLSEILVNFYNKRNNDDKRGIVVQYPHYLSALRTKPFMLLAGISGTGKSRIVREMAKACWKEGDEEYGKNNPRNFCMVQVKPNWHDSSELIGYVSRLNGEKYVVGPFLRFLAAALKEPEVPYFLCLDEMNLAPVEQYFAEYLSVIESRKLNPDGTITTDPIIEYENTDAYGSLIDQLFDTPEERKAYKTDEGGKRLTIPQNLFVVGTVNMDETTFSFSRKVLDRAMTIEMNEVDLHGGLEKGTGNEIGYIGNSIIGDAAEGCDVYEDNKELCDQVLAYLVKVNEILEGTPFKIAYRTRNEFLMYAVNRKTLAPESQLWQTLDEMTSMKILSRIEGDSDRTQTVLEKLKALVDEQIVAAIPPAEEGKPSVNSISATKIDEMLAKLKSTSFTSYWT